TATTAASLVAVALDESRDVLSYSYGSNTGYLLNPVAGFAAQSLAGAITGTVDTTALPSGHPAVTVSAQTTSSDGTHHVVVVRGTVASDGSFSLYPLPLTSSSSTALFDVVISCAGADTVVVKDVKVSAGTAASSPTILASSAIALAPAATTVYANLGTQSPTMPAGGRVAFYQTIQATGEVPYAVDATAVDPVTHRLPDDEFALASGPLMVGTYANGGAITFSQQVPSEGKGVFLVGSGGPYWADSIASAASKVSSTSSSTPTVVVAPIPGMGSAYTAGSLAVTVSSVAGRYDSGFLIVTAGNRVLDTVDVGSALAAGGGTVTVGNLPVGTSVGVPLSIGVRAWNSRSAASTLVSVAGSGSVTLTGATGTASVTVQ
ncbi:MAG TPA: hypothetical protein VMT50_06065, partial [Steroidobacteraceae bacterium]|nr:hypothetical protein [Steroidobacteraceae bacterium]